MKYITCDCPTCRAMCEKSTCLPTPEQARELIRRGYGPRLATFTNPATGQGFIGPAPVGGEGARDIPHTRFGPCTFKTPEGLCELHALGLKPEEGKLAHHDRDWRLIRFHVGRTWAGRRFQSVLAKLEKT